MSREYVWERGDTLATIAIKYCRGPQWKELLTYNLKVLWDNRHIMKPGDVIEIPDSWFPIPNHEYGIKVVGSSGYRIDSNIPAN